MAPEQGSSEDPNYLRILDLEKELQFAKLDLEEMKSRLIAVQHDLKLQSQNSADLRDSEVREKTRALFQDLSSPLVQLLTQNHMQHVQGKRLNSKDFNATITRLISSLENHGLEISEEAGSTSFFDPNRHEPLMIDDTIELGEEIVIRMCGISFEGKILRRAAVSRLPKPE